MQTRGFPWIASAAAASIALTAFAQEKKPSPPKAEVGEPAPLFELKGCDGKTYKLAAYKDKGLNLTTEFAVVEGADGWDGTIGHVTQLLRYELIGSGPDVYLCGPPPMIEAGQSWLADQKVDEKLIHVEKFLPS